MNREEKLRANKTEDSNVCKRAKSDKFRDLKSFSLLEISLIWEAVSVSAAAIHNLHIIPIDWNNFEKGKLLCSALIFSFEIQNIKAKHNFLRFCPLTINVRNVGRAASAKTQLIFPSAIVCWWLTRHQWHPVVAFSTQLRFLRRTRQDKTNIAGRVTFERGSFSTGQSCACAIYYAVTVVQSKGSSLSSEALNWTFVVTYCLWVNTASIVVASRDFTVRHSN